MNALEDRVHKGGGGGENFGRSTLGGISPLAKNREL